MRFLLGFLVALGLLGTACTKEDHLIVQYGTDGKAAQCWQVYAVPTVTTGGCLAWNEDGWAFFDYDNVVCGNWAGTKVTNLTAAKAKLGATGLQCQEAR